jgi:hypothetical protein
MSTLTKTATLKLARSARRHGYFDTGRTLWVSCPICRERVETDRYPNMSIVRQLDAAILLHLESYHDAPDRVDPRSS